MAEFDPQKMIVSRGKVYNKVTGRFLGNLHEFDDVPVTETGGASGIPHADDLTKPDLVKLAKENEVAGYSSMTKDELAAALAGVGAVDDSERDSGESGAESE